MYIDTHCHLNFSEFDTDRAMVIGNAKKASVKKIIVPGVDYASSRSAVLLAKNNPGSIYAAAGYHPYEAPHNPDPAGLKSFVSAHIHEIAAIGEIGLDYHKYKGEIASGKKEVQQILLKEQMLIALEYDLPVILHCREAFRDLFLLFSTLPRIPRGVLHCFSGGLQDIRTAEKLGLYIGIDGNVTYSRHLSMILSHIPLSMLLLETDAPNLTPEPYRGTRNEPKYIPRIARYIADCMKKPMQEIKKATTENACSLFRI